MATEMFFTQLSASGTEQTYTLPPLRWFSILVTGSTACIIRLDEDIDAGTTPSFSPQVPYTFRGAYSVLNYKTASGTTTVEIIGERRMPGSNT